MSAKMLSVNNEAILISFCRFPAKRKTPMIATIAMLEIPVRKYDLPANNPNAAPLFSARTNWSNPSMTEYASYGSSRSNAAFLLHRSSSNPPIIKGQKMRCVFRSGSRVIRCFGVNWLRLSRTPLSFVFASVIFGVYRAAFVASDNCLRFILNRRALYHSKCCCQNLLEPAQILFFRVLRKCLTCPRRACTIRRISIEP